MQRVRGFKLVQHLPSMAIVGVVMLALNSGIALAAYGPPAPAPAPVPGGFSCVVTSQTVSPAGKLIGPLRLQGLVATIRVRKGNFGGSTQITITEPFTRSGACQGGPGVGNAGFGGYRALGGVGILVQVSGSAWPGTFRRPISLHLASRSIRRSSRVVVWNGMRFARAPHAVVRRRSAWVPVAANSDVAVLTRIRSSRRSDSTRAVRLASAVGTRGASRELLAALFLRPAGWPLPGLGVMAPARLSAISARGALLAPDHSPR